MTIEISQIGYNNLLFYLHVIAATSCKSTHQGTTYAGSVAQTVSGANCKAWDESSPDGSYYEPEDFPDTTIEETSNYCRNPGIV